MTTRNPFLAKHSVTVTQTDGSTRVDDEDVREFTLVATDPTGPPDDAVENEIAIVSGQLAIYDGVSTWEPLTGFIGTGTDNAIARYDGTGEIQETGILVDDADAITGVTTLTIGNIVIDDTADTVVGVGSVDVDNVNIDGNTISTTDTDGDLTLAPDGAGVVAVSSNLTVAGTIAGTDSVTFGEKSADPADPAEGRAVMWMSDGTGTGDDGDILIKVTAGAATKTATLVDFSAI